ncbi:MAG: hypothetical protein MJ197_10870, partial [Bacteroidales bacterium]|nr:hypothetical protein [Bacteroidales bacterium]
HSKFLLYICSRIEKNILVVMLKPKNIPVLTGAAARRFNAMIHDGSLKDSTNYSMVVRDLEVIMARS